MLCDPNQLNAIHRHFIAQFKIRITNNDIKLMHSMKYLIFDTSKTFKIDFLQLN